MRKIFYFLAVVFVVSLTACKKDKQGGTNNNDDGSTPPATGTALDKLRDSVYLYPKETYLWYSQLPSYKNFQPRNYVSADTITGLSTEVDKLSQFAINPTSNRPYEYYDASGTAKYSFIDDGAVSNELGGNGGDFGFSVFYPSRSDLRIKYVYPGSPADKLGVKRGYQITKINGRTDLTYDDGGSTTQFVIQAYAYSKTITMTLTRYDGTSIDVTLNTANYTINPVITYKTLDAGSGKSVGYMVFNSFTDKTNAGPKILEALSSFSGLSDVIIDLRYNGGGSVETAEYFDNLLVPSTKNGTKMYTAYFNDKLTNDNYTLFKKLYDIPNGFFSVSNQTVNFQKQGSFNFSKIIFLVGGGTASASELTINNLLGISGLDVELIGDQTYGKPVGFYGIDINKYQLYMPMFSTKNASGNGDYYDGMLPGSGVYKGKLADDDLSKDFGDPTENLVSQALYYIANGKYKTTSTQTQSFASSSKSLMTTEQKRVMVQKFNQSKIKGLMLKTPAVFKKKK
jgi:C-terminal processing protease CtpA/Prc